jgi:hypothetical protein
MFEKDNVKKEMEDLRRTIADMEIRFSELEKKFAEIEKIKEAMPKEFCSTIKGFENDEDYQKLHSICTDIATKDESFKFDGNSEAREIYIYSFDKDKLHKRSMWLVKKTGIENLIYTIR